MFSLLFKLGVLLVALIIVGNLWVRFIHPFLFEETIEDKLDDAVEQKIMDKTDKKVDEILNEEV